LLSLDVGGRRVGVAVSDDTGLIASPLTTIRRTSKAADFDKIARLVQEQRAGALVIGLPLNRDGSVGPQAQRVERYAAALAESLRAQGLGQPVIFWDEHLSTQRADEAMIVAGRKARDRRDRIDAAAAAVILQDYLDDQRQSAEGGQASCSPEPLAG
jgi:putative Holliday junction resolvase